MKLNLNGAIFDDAILIRADFSEAKLKEASFDRADLEDARFINADLSGAILTQTKTKQVGIFSTQYAWDRLSDYLSRVGMPDFSCADLTDADFEGRVLFGLIRDDSDLIYYSNFEATSFRFSNLTRTNLGKIGVYGVDPSSDVDLPFTPRVGGASGVHKDQGKKYWSFEYELGVTSELTSARALYTNSLSEMAHAFTGANWNESILPPALKRLLNSTNNVIGKAADRQKEYYCDTTRPIL